MTVLSDYKRVVEAPNIQSYEATIEAQRTALEAKDKELAALREQYLQSQTDLQNALGDRDEATKQQVRAEARAETAERELDASNANHRAMAKQLADLGRERDEARAALKPLAAYSVGAILKDENFDYRIHVCCSMDDQPQFKHFAAARAITGED